MRKAKLPTWLGAAKADSAVTSLRKHARLRGRPLKGRVWWRSAHNRAVLFLCGAAGCVERPVAVLAGAGGECAGRYVSVPVVTKHGAWNRFWPSLQVLTEGVPVEDIV